MMRTTRQILSDPIPTQPRFMNGDHYCTAYQITERYPNGDVALIEFLERDFASILAHFRALGYAWTVKVTDACHRVPEPLFEGLSAPAVVATRDGPAIGYEGTRS